MASAPSDAELEALEKELEQYKSDAARQLDELAALTQAADACVADSKRETHEARFLPAVYGAASRLAWVASAARACATHPSLRCECCVPCALSCLQFAGQRGSVLGLTPPRHAQFTRDVLHGGPGGGPLDVDKTLWHLEASAARDETLLQKMTARSRRLRADIMRLEKKIADQTSARRATSAVFRCPLALTPALPAQRGKGPSTMDFEALRGEIAALEPAVEAAAREAMSLKASCARAEQTLLDTKAEQAAVEAETDRVQKQATARMAEAARRDEDAGRARSEQAAAERQLEGLRAAAAAAPPLMAMDYIALKAQVASLEKQCHNLERKIEVAQLAARNGGGPRVSAAPTRKRPPTADPAKKMAGVLGVQTLRPAAA